jgi:hypothetical protein
VKGARSRFAKRYGWLASLMVTVLAIAPLLAIFHQASVRHAVCEHGDLIESAHHAEAASERSAADEAGAGSAGFQPDSAPAVHGHNHCSVGTLAKAGAGIVAPAAGVRAASESFVVPVVRREVAYARPVLPSAPKTSPPSACVVS